MNTSILRKHYQCLCIGIKLSNNSPRRGLKTFIPKSNPIRSSSQFLLGLVLIHHFSQGASRDRSLGADSAHQRRSLSHGVITFVNYLLKHFFALVRTIHVLLRPVPNYRTPVSLHFVDGLLQDGGTSA